MIKLINVSNGFECDGCIYLKEGCTKPALDDCCEIDSIYVEENENNESI